MGGRRSPKSVGWFRKVYDPVLSKLGDSAARARVNGSNKRPNNGALTPERAKTIGKLGGVQHYLEKLPPEERRKFELAMVGRVHASNRKMPAARRSEIASAAARARWARYTPEERELHKAQVGRALAKAHEARWGKRAFWPFPFTPAKPTAEEIHAKRVAAILKAGKRSRAAARLRKHLKRVNGG